MKTTASSRTTRLAAAGLALLLPALALADSAKLAGDAYVNPGDGANYGTLPTVNVGGAAASSGLLLFDLTTLPSTTGVAWARLRVYVDTVNTSGTLDLGAASGAWTETTVNGLGGVTVGSTIATASIGSTGYVTFDVSSQVSAWLAGAPNYGFILTADAGTPSLSIAIDSKESPSTSHPAVLEVVFSGAAGSEGLEGIPGTLGESGPAGATGPAGPTGATGPAGIQGSTGSPGSAGAAGPTGTTGPVGATGSAGATGAPGLAGAVGATGPTGATGAAGATGTAGSAGATGAIGPTGAPGSAGPAGAIGAPFSNVFNASSSSGSYSIPDSTTDSVFFTSSGGSVALPTAASQTGRKLWIVMTNISGANHFTVTSSSSNIFTSGTCPVDPCVGVATVSFDSAAQFFSDGSRWNAAYTNE
jgi:hypothetical protein